MSKRLEGRYWTLSGEARYSSKQCFCIDISDLPGTYRKNATWVHDNEPGTLTYAILTRPKAPNEFLVYERYLGVDGLKAHMKSQRAAEMM